MGLCPLPVFPCWWLSALGHCGASRGCCVWGLAEHPHGMELPQAGLTSAHVWSKGTATLTSVLRCLPYAPCLLLSSPRGAVSAQRVGGRQGEPGAVPHRGAQSRPRQWAEPGGDLAAAAQQALEHQCLEPSPAARAGPRTMVSPIVLVTWSPWWHWWWLFRLSYEWVLMGPWQPHPPTPPNCLPSVLTVASMGLGDVAGFE